MSKDFACRGSLCRIQAEEGREQSSSGGGQEGKFRSNYVPSRLGGARETE